MAALTRDQLVRTFLDNRATVDAAVPTTAVGDLDQQRAAIRDALAAAGIDLDDPAVAETVMRLARVLDDPSLLDPDWRTSAVMAARMNPGLAAVGLSVMFALGWVGVAAAERIETAGGPADG